MATDARDRRLRFAAPAPRARDGAVFPQEADLIQWELIDRHGPLPLPYLAAATLHLRHNYASLQERYTRLYHAGWVRRPEAQCASFHARYAPLVYDLTPRARNALADRLSAYAPVRSTWFVHQLMQACVGASFELLAPAGLRYVARSEVLTSWVEGAARGAQNPMAVPLPTAAKHLIPDDLFALERQGKRRYFIVEIDRATESMTPLAGSGRGQSAPTYFGKKLESYRDAATSGQLAKWWGFSTPRLIIVTTNEARLRHVMDRVRALNAPAISNHTYATVVPGFGDLWRTPKRLLTELYSPWTSVAGSARIIDP